MQTLVKPRQSPWCAGQCGWCRWPSSDPEDTRLPCAPQATALPLQRLWVPITMHQPGGSSQGLGCLCLWGTITSPATCLRDLGSQAGGQARDPVVGALSPNCWTNREPQTPGNINRSEASGRSSSQHQDPALPNCLQTPVLDVSGQTTRKTGIQHHPSKKKKKMK